MFCDLGVYHHKHRHRYRDTDTDTDTDTHTHTERERDRQRERARESEREQKMSNNPQYILRGIEDFLDTDLVYFSMLQQHGEKVRR